jgi:two-component system, NarL family, response regulator DevR
MVRPRPAPGVTSGREFQRHAHSRAPFPGNPRILGSLRGVPNAQDSQQPRDIRVMIIDDHEVVRRGIAEIVDRADGLTVVAEAGSVAEAVRRAELVRPEVLLVDLQLPDGTGIDIVRTLREKVPDARPVVLTSFDDDDALAEALEAGAKAYLLKTVRGAEIAEVVKAVAAGRTLLDERTVTRRRADHEDPTADLTPSERRVLELIGDGLSNREIGERLGVAEKTVKNHITSLLSKMGLQRRTQVAAWVAGQRAAGWRG